MELKFTDMTNPNYSHNSLDTVVFEKIRNFSAMKGRFYDERYRIYKRSKKEYYVTWEVHNSKTNTWELKESTVMMPKYKTAKLYLGSNVIGYDACSNGFEKRQLYWHYMWSNRKEALEYYLSNLGAFIKLILKVILFAIYLIIGFKFIIGGVNGLGIKDEFFQDFLILILGTIVFVAPLVYFDKNKL